MHRFLLVISLFFSFLLAGYSQNNISEPIKGIKVFPQTRFRAAASSASQIFNQEFQLSNENEFRLKETPETTNGFTSEDYEQFYNDLKVEFGQASLNKKDGNLLSMSFNVYDLTGLSTGVSLSSTDALNRAIIFVSASKYLWEDPQEAAMHDNYTKPTGELVILPNLNDESSNALLAFKFDIYAIEPNYRAEIFVDANTGEILLENKILHEFDVPANGQSLYDGVVNFTAGSNNDFYRLRETGRGGGINTYDMQSGTSYSAAVDVIDNSTTFSTEKSIGVQAHWSTERTYDYFLQKHNRNSYDNQGAPLNSYVSYGSNYSNAFFNGSSMTYGDGYAGAWVPLDIVGHEITHGVTRKSSNLVYQKESGALNESFSDIFGEMIENFAKGSNDWLMANEVGFGGSGGAIRSMSNPNQYGDPDTYGGSYWINPNCSPASYNDYCGVHTNSGVQNYWFYLLSQGGAGINDLGNSYDVNAIGVEKAAAIAYRNLTTYLNSTSNFADARVGAIQSAIDLYGAESAEKIAVTNAWHAVGVGDEHVFKVNINAGGLTTTYNDIEFGSDEYFQQGETTIVTASDLPEPYQSYRSSTSKELNYKIPVANDVYIVKLHFAELWFGAASGTAGGTGSRIFDINLENILVQDNLDVYDEVGADTILVKTYKIEVLDGELNIDFSSLGVDGGVYEPIINAIEIIDNGDSQSIIPFVTSWKIENNGSSNYNQITIPFLGSNSYDIDWGDGVVDTGVSSTITHTYGQIGTYQIEIVGGYRQFSLSNSSDRSKLISVDQWGDTSWVTMENAFRNCNNVQILASDVPDLSNATSMASMFYNADSFNEDISSWNTSNITNMSYMLYDANGFNQDISSLDTSNVTDMSYMFYNASSFDQNLGGLDISSITNLYRILSYSGISSTNYDNSLIGWSQMTNLNTNVSLGAENISFCLGAEARQTLIDSLNWNIFDAGLACPSTVAFISSWKTDNQGNSEDNQITIPYSGTGSFNIDWGDGSTDENVSSAITHTYDTIGTYQISIIGVYPNVTFGNSSDANKLISVDQWGDAIWQSMTNAFYNCTNVQILASDVPNLTYVTSLRNMFYNADNFNEDISNWDTSNVTDMSSMFYQADAFNQDISSWDTSKVTNMSQMFNSASSFNQNLENLDISSVTTLYNLLSNSGMSSDNYDSTLIAWSELEDLNSNLSFGAQNIHYCTGADARQLLIDNFGWYISDAGLACPITIPFITSWKTDNEASSGDNQVIIPYSGSGTYSIDWGDGNTDEDVSQEMVHTYEEVGTYQIGITGTYPRIPFGGSEDANKLVSVDQWGDSKWSTMYYAFRDCGNLQIIASDNPDLSNVTDMSYMFYNTDNFNSDISNWDTKGVINMNYLFYEANSFNQSLGDWDISSVTTMYRMLSYTNMSIENYDATLIAWSELDGINQNVSLSAEGANFCQGADARQILIDTYDWNISDDGLACESTLPFISTWKIEDNDQYNYNKITIPYSGTGTYNIDWGDGSFNQNVTSSKTHTYAEEGDYQISIVGVYPKITFGNSEHSVKLQSIDQWGDTAWQSMENAFYNCTNVQILASDLPDISNVTSLRNMFYNADKFNTDISNWNTSNVTDMSSAFYEADSFNQDLSTIDISSVTNMYNMFSYSGLSTDNYDSMLIAWSQLEGLDTNLSLGAYNIPYCSGTEARQKLIDDYNWNINDAGLACPNSVAFITSWKTDNEGGSEDNQISFPYSGTGSYNIDWGDGTIDENVSSTITHTYDDIGTYQISILGIYPKITLSSSYDRYKLVSVDQWGDSKWNSLTSAFSNCDNVQILASDVPDLSNVTSLSYMFYDADSFNTDISSWDTSNITDMSNMFYYANSFNQNLATLDISSVTNMSNMFSYSGLSTDNYDSILIAWSQLEGLDTNLSLGAYNIPYCSGTEARQKLIDDYNWYINDAGLACPNTIAFITSWKTDNEGGSNDNQISFPYSGSGSYSIDWGDGTVDENVSSTITHTYDAIGTYQISIIGVYPRLSFGNTSDVNKLISVDQWGDSKWNSLTSAFSNCANVQILASDVPDLNNITSLSYMFYNADNFNADISNWDLSNVSDLSYMFYSADSFNQNLGALNISSVSNMYRIFSYSGLSADNYDNTLIGWSDLEDLKNYVSLGADNINYCFGVDARQKLIDDYNWYISDAGLECNYIPFVTTWKTDNFGASADNQITIPTSDSETYDYTVDWGDGSTSSNVTGDITHTYAVSGTYEVSITGVFPKIIFGYTGDIGKIIAINQWGNNRWSSFNRAFSGCNNLQLLATDSPDLSDVNSLAAMFNNADSMNTDISHWDTSTITNMSFMFFDADTFNQNISSWNISNATNMSYMFYGADSFNQDISTWEVSEGVNMSNMFNDAQSFDQDLANFQISGISNLSGFLNNSGMSMENYDKTLIGWSSQIGQVRYITLGADGINYCLGETARQELIDTHNWNIIDAGNDCQAAQGPFITTWKTDNEGESDDNQITINVFPNTTSYTYDYSVDWGDGTSDSGVTTAITHTYDSPGTYTVAISGEYPAPKLGIINGVQKDNLKLLEVNQWGEMQWQNLGGTFDGCANLDVVATDVPDLTLVNSISFLFRGCESLVYNNSINSWDVSEVSLMDSTFSSCKLFNQDVSDWNVENVTKMGGMFQFSGFNQNISNWNVGMVTNMNQMFSTSPFNQNISSWNVANVEDMIGMFRLSAFNQDISSWDVGKVATMGLMFEGAELSLDNYDNTLISWSALNLQNSVEFDGGNSQYCLGADARQKLIDDFAWTITDAGESIVCSEIARPFITTWKTNNYGSSDNNEITIETYDDNPIIQYNYDFNVDWGDGSTSSNISSSITHTYAATGTYQVSISGNYPRIAFGASGDKQKILSVDQWGDQEWTNMSSAFSGCRNVQILASDSPDLSNVSSFYQMFNNADSMNNDISSWDTSNITVMNFMFFDADSFNQDISSWNTSSVSQMSYMFYGADTFNQSLAGWDTSATLYFDYMFTDAVSFDQDLSLLDFSSAQWLGGMLSNSGMSTENYDKLLVKWADQENISNYMTVGVDGIAYCDGEAARQTLIDNFSWNFSDAGKADDCDGSEEQPFITTWKTDNEGFSEDNQITIPTVDGEIYNYKITWGDGSTTENVTGEITHTYANPGTYEISIEGEFPRLQFFPNSAAETDYAKLLIISQWGDIEWTSMFSAFMGCYNLDVTATDVPNLSQVTSMNYMFFGCENLEGNMSFNDWDVSTVNEMAQMLTRATSFNQDIGSWYVGNVKRFTGMFEEATSFNQDISSWDTSSAESMYAMFSNASDFNQDISLWNLELVEATNLMFRNAISFNQDLSNWNVSNVVDMALMFDGAGLTDENYDKTLIGWGSQSVQSNVAFDAGNSKYCMGETARQKLIDDFGWTITDAGKSTDCVIDESRPFITTWKTNNYGSSANNEITIKTSSLETYNYIVDWGDGSSNTGVTDDITHAYEIAGTYQISISGDYPRIAFGDSGDKQKLLSVDQWGDQQWTDMSSAFGGCRNMQVLATDAPDLSLVTSLDRMFNNADNLNNDISGWDTSNIISMSFMFFDADAFNQDISSWDTSSVTTMSYMFFGADLFDQSILGWDTSSVIHFDYMFYNATSFNQDLSLLDYSSAALLSGMLSFTALSIENYDKLLIKWAAQDGIESYRSIGADGLEYCEGELARQLLVDDYGWNISDEGKSTSCDTGLNLSARSLITNNLTLSPNPAVHMATLKFEKPVQLVQIQIFDITGRLVHTYKGSEVVDDGAYLLNVNAIPTGTYFIKSHDEQGKQYQKQMVIKK